MNVNLLVGSGISIPSKLPNVDEITNRLLHGKWAFQSNRYIEIEDEQHKNDPSVLSFQKLLQHMQLRYSTKGHCLNYEDLFFVLDSLKNYQMYPDEYYLYKNEYNFYYEYFDTNLKPHDSYDLTIVVDDIFKYFQLTIHSLLNQNDCISGLNIFSEINHDDNLNLCNIFSLNHDILIEEYFKKNECGFSSGFTEEDGDVTLFTYDGLKSSEEKFRLVKLHGSIDWYSFPQEPGQIKQARYGVPQRDLNDLKNKNGQKYDPLFNYPHFLSGTLNKISDYNNSTFFELRNYFFLQLEEINNLVVSGYGWRDEGINKIIYSWLNKTRENKIHLLYKKVNDETGIRSYSFFKDRNQLYDYGDYLQNVDWSAINKNL